jgi:hypothetical protein
VQQVDAHDIYPRARLPSLLRADLSPASATHRARSSRRLPGPGSLRPMRRRLWSLLGAGCATAALVFGLPVTGAWAAPAAVGYDVSHPQCGADLPSGQAFAVVGVNGGRATTANPCLTEQLRWAARSTGAANGQPPIQLYVNTANPGELRNAIDTWPRSGSTPYGSCTAGNTLACSWRYGWERARATVEDIFTLAARAAGLTSDPARYIWWLDVETGNTWQSGSAAALTRNRGSLAGMAAYLAARGGRPGLYSSPAQWRQIAGEVTESSALYRLDSWVAGASSQAGAAATCDRPPLVGAGRVVMAQYVMDNQDHNLACD